MARWLHLVKVNQQFLELSVDPFLFKDTTANQYDASNLAALGSGKSGLVRRLGVLCRGLSGVVRHVEQPAKRRASLRAVRSAECSKGHATGAAEAPRAGQASGSSGAGKANLLASTVTAATGAPIVDEGGEVQGTHRDPHEA